MAMVAMEVPSHGVLFDDKNDQTKSDEFFLGFLKFLFQRCSVYIYFLLFLCVSSLRLEMRI